jgi:hypothetical protein
MDRMIAYCGLACDTCPIHLATLEKDDLKRRRMRVSIARLCAEMYGMDLRAADITDCDGCRAGGRLFAGCQDCEIRACAEGRGIESCGSCSEYPCDLLEPHLTENPAARTRLETLRAGR